MCENSAPKYDFVSEFLFYCWVLFDFWFIFYVFPDSNQDVTQETVTSTQKPDNPDGSLEKVEPVDNGLESSKPVHKWPIRPGVHVHVNGLHTLGGITSVGIAQTPDLAGFSYGAKNSAGSGGGSDSGSNSNKEDGEFAASESGNDEAVPEPQTQRVAKGVSTDSECLAKVTEMTEEQQNPCQSPTQYPVSPRTSQNKSQGNNN